MRGVWIGLGAAIALFSAGATASAQQTSAPTSAVYAPPQLPPRNETPEARRARWEAWRAANADIDARIATFLRDTEARIAEYRNGPSEDRFSALREGVTAARRREALTYFSNAFLVWQAEDFAAAEIGFRRGLEIDPTNGSANFYLGDLLRRRGDNAGARDYFERSVAFGAGSTEALRAEAALARLPAGGDPAINEPPVIWDAASRPALIWDAAEAPEMVVIPAGGYAMGSPSSEAGRDSDEGPQHRVTLARPFAVSRFEVTRGQYAAFAAATRRTAGNYCRTDRGHPERWERDRNGTWRDPGFRQTNDEPVVCVVWEDARDYVAWLSQTTGRAYRLLSEAEWEYVARARTTSDYPWSASASRENANYGAGSGAQGSDQWERTAPVGSFQANAFGVYDMHGNVFEWTQDCYLNSYSGAPNDGRARETGGCAIRVNRGGSWHDRLSALRTANREGGTPEYRFMNHGFRVARTL
ncbi:MAG: SUMF1/EgtB/PvdO family nonheme iron enzyme [Hyphomonadaceae bacterium]|nr:SUMF1/EgtB/PvdO family nonheme iron enzyme [Hyphomonadaceae bacterium]